MHDFKEAFIVTAKEVIVKQGLDWRKYKHSANLFANALKNIELIIGKDQKPVADLSLWNAVFNDPRFKRTEAMKLYQLSKVLKGKLFSNESSTYPLDIYLKTPNKLPGYYLTTKLKDISKVKKLEEQLTADMKDCNEIVQYEYLLNTYLQLCSIQEIAYGELSKLRIDNNFIIEKRIVFMVAQYQDINEHNIPKKLIDFDDRISSKFIDYFKLFPEEEGLFGQMYLFTQTKARYKKFIHEYIANFDSSSSVRIVKNAVKYTLHIEQSPFAVTLHNQKKSPPISLLELNALFPGQVPHTPLLHEQKYLKKFVGVDGNEEFEEISLQKFINADTELSREFNNLLKIKITQKEERIREIRRRKKLFKEMRKLSSYDDEKKMIDYIVYLLDSLETQHENNLAFSTFITTLYTLRRYVFRYMFKSMILDEHIVNILVEEVFDNKDMEEATYKKYAPVINDFFMHAYDVSFNSIHTKFRIRKSIVLESELFAIVDKLISEDRARYKTRNNTDKTFYMIHRRAVFTILAFYSGLRKTELRSRQIYDWYQDGDEWVFDVNKSSLRKLIRLTKEPVKTIKTAAGVRIVSFKINNTFQDMVKKFFKITEDLPGSFIFKHIKKVQTKKRGEETKYKLMAKPATESEINTINDVIKLITGRYTSIHSLRHSYYTYQLLDIFYNSENHQKALFELNIKIGHSNPLTGISYYGHVQLLPYLILNRSLMQSKIQGYTSNAA